ncbi:N-acetylmuramoyl-L-alanine amidase [Streptomyces sp. NPDC057250]|uniref:peptidoglycan recognition protein family protein n=1 Tax=Streptomyces sp. NPDC057250 TaxID=3346068 RepID=UPI00362A5CD4
MSAPATADRFLGALRQEGLAVIEVGNWRTHNRNHMGPWGEVHGVMIHHTVTRGTAHTVAMCRDGYAGLPGPLCHGVIAKSGAVHLVGYGRANHAGLGDPDVLRAVIAETRLPRDDEATVDGNRHFYGFECENAGDGLDPWPAVQLEAIERVSAALCRLHRWGAGSVLGHLEWQPGKPDPLGFTMDAMRGRIAGRLGVPVPPPPPVPQMPVVDFSRLLEAARTDRFRPGTPVSYAGVRILETALVDEGLLSAPYSDGHYGWQTLAAYSRWQERLGYRGREPGQPADGIPGWSSAVQLGKRRAFALVA